MSELELVMVAHLHIW